MIFVCAGGYFWKDEFQRGDELGVVGVEAVVPHMVWAER